MSRTLSADLLLPYYKQGDDLVSCRVMKKDGKVDVKASLLKHVEKLQKAIDKLQEVHDRLPDDNQIDIHANCHSIMLTGERNFIQRLTRDGLLYISPLDEE